MSLTDDWKARKLKMGWYYVRFNCYKNPMPTYYSKKYNEFSNDGNVEEVLASVPSYEEVQEMKSQIRHLKDLQTNEDKEIERLRDLLKECKPYIQKDFEYIRANGWKEAGCFNELYSLLTRINAAIGESEE